MPANDNKVAIATRRRPRIWVAVLVVVALVAGGIVAALYWPREQNQHSGRSPLEGKLTVSLSRSVGKMRASKSVDAPDALPVRAGDMMHLEARYPEPAHTFILWLDASGKIIPLYPWNMDELETRDLKKAPACQAVHVISNPMTLGKGWAFEKGSGLVTLLFLARRAPGGEAVAWEDLVGAGVPAAKIRDRQEFAILQMKAGSADVQVVAARNRGDEAEAKAIDRDLIAVMERLRAEFDLVHAIRFAQVAD